MNTPWSAQAPPVRAAEELARLNPEELLVRAAPKIGRNGPCPCGSGKKYKKCCL
jgi:uncharacterized protein YecA (UPF0149 family)